jgi:hypothetical protein
MKERIGQINAEQAGRLLGNSSLRYRQQTERKNGIRIVDQQTRPIEGIIERVNKRIIADQLNFVDDFSTQPEFSSVDSRPVTCALRKETPKGWKEQQVTIVPKFLDILIAGPQKILETVNPIVGPIIYKAEDLVKKGKLFLRRDPRKAQSWIAELSRKRRKQKLVLAAAIIGLTAGCAPEASEEATAVTEQVPEFEAEENIPAPIELNPEPTSIPENWTRHYPFFKSKELACSKYSIVEDVGPGQIREYLDPEAKSTEEKICYFVSSLKLYDMPEGAEISFVPSWCPTTGCGGIQPDFWGLSHEDRPFTIGYPLPAGSGVLYVNGQSLPLNLNPGENPFSVAPSSYQEELRDSGANVRKLWSIGQTVDSTTNRILTENDVYHFGTKTEAIVKKLLNAMSEGILPEKGALWLTIGTNSNDEVVLVAQYYDQGGSIQALFYPNEQNDFQLLRLSDLEDKGAAVVYSKGVIYAFANGNKLIRKKDRWLGVQETEGIGGRNELEDSSNGREIINNIVETKDLFSNLPIYLPAVNEPVAYVVEKFGISLDDLVRINPGLGEEVNAIDGVRLPIQPKSIDQTDLLTIRDYGILGFEAPSAEEILGFLNERGWESVPLTIDLIPARFATDGSHVNPCPKGWSFRQNPERHYAVVYIYNRPDQERFLWHEICHELVGSNETDAWECAREAGY